MSSPTTLSRAGRRQKFGGRRRDRDLRPRKPIEKLIGGMRSAALPWCPSWAGAGPTIPDCLATLGGALLGNRRTLHRLLLCLRFGLHRCLGHVYALSLLSLVRISSNL